MNAEIKYLVKLKEIKASLQKQINELDIAIYEISAKNIPALKHIANQETIGVYDYKSCITGEDKIKFALQKLGKSNFSTLSKFLQILGEEKTGSDLLLLIENGIQGLYRQKILKQIMVNSEMVYFLQKKIAGRS